MVRRLEASADKSSRESSIKKSGTRISFKLLGRERAGTMGNKDAQPVTLKKAAATMSKLTPYMRAPNTKQAKQDAASSH